MDVSELRAWLFKVYTICKDSEAYKDLNKRMINIYNYIQTALNEESIMLCDSIYYDREI